MTEEQIRCVKDGLSRQKLYIALGCIEELEKENEQLKQQNAKMKCCYLCKSVYNCAFADVFNFHCCDKWELAE